LSDLGLSADIQAELGALLGPEAVLSGTPARYLADATESRGLRGAADAVVLPGSTEEVARVLRWCYEREVAVVPRGGGSGFAAGAVPVDGGVVLGLERMTRIREFEPLRWRACVEAGVPTAVVRRLARENGLVFPPDPGAAEQSLIGGNIATNAGGPHAFKYGVTGAWVTGLEAVIPPGDVVTVGGPIRKDVAGYDLKSLLIGSEGTLGVITAAWLRLLPAPEAARCRSPPSTAAPRPDAARSRPCWAPDWFRPRWNTSTRGRWPRRAARSRCRRRRTPASWSSPRPTARPPRLGACDPNSLRRSGRTRGPSTRRRNAPRSRPSGAGATASRSP
jgi:FAD binding domain